MNRLHRTAPVILPEDALPAVHAVLVGVVIRFSACCQTEATNQRGRPGAHGDSTGPQPRAWVLNKPTVSPPCSLLLHGHPLAPATGPSCCGGRNSLEPPCFHSGPNWPFSQQPHTWPFKETSHRSEHPCSCFQTLQWLSIDYGNKVQSHFQGLWGYLESGSYFLSGQCCNHIPSSSYLLWPLLLPVSGTCAATSRFRVFAPATPSSWNALCCTTHLAMWELDYKESWAQKNWCFELWCWRRLLRVPWTARRSNQSILKEISTGCSLEGLMLKLKLQYFGHLMQRTNLTGKDPDAGKD